MYTTIIPPFPIFISFSLFFFVLLRENHSKILAWFYYADCLESYTCNHFRYCWEILSHLIDETMINASTRSDKHS